MGSQITITKTIILFNNNCFYEKKRQKFATTVFGI